MTGELKLVVDGRDHHVEILQLHPGDCLVVTLADARHYRADLFEELARVVRERIGPGIKVLILPAGTQLSVARQADGEDDAA